MKKAFTLLQVALLFVFFSILLHSILRSNYILQQKIVTPTVTTSGNIVTTSGNSLIQEYFDNIIKYAKVKGALPKNFDDCIDAEADRVFSASFYDSIATKGRGLSRECLPSSARSNPINYFIDPDPRYLTDELKPFNSEYQPYINPGLFCGRAVGFTINDNGKAVNNVAFVIVSPGSDGKFDSNKVNGVYTISGDDIALYKTVNEMYVLLNCDQRIKNLANINPTNIIPISRLPQMFGVSSLRTGRLPKDSILNNAFDFIKAEADPNNPLIYNGFYNNELDPDVGQFQFYIPVDLGFSLMSDYGQGCVAILDDKKQPVNYNLAKNIGTAYDSSAMSSHYVRRVLYLYAQKRKIVIGNNYNRISNYLAYGAFYLPNDSIYNIKLTNLPAISDFRFVSFGRSIKYYRDPVKCESMFYYSYKTKMCTFFDATIEYPFGYLFSTYALTMYEVASGVFNQECYTNDSALVHMSDVDHFIRPQGYAVSPVFRYQLSFTPLKMTTGFLFEFYESQQGTQYIRTLDTIPRRMDPKLYLTQPSTVHGYNLFITNRAHHVFNDQSSYMLLRYKPSQVLVDSGLPSEIMVEMPLTMKSINNNNTVDMYSGIRQFNSKWVD